MVKPNEFILALSRSPRVKLQLAWLTLGALAVPAAFLMTLGIPEKLVLPLLVALVVPFQYFVYSLIAAKHKTAARRRVRDSQDGTMHVPSTVR